MRRTDYLARSIRELETCAQFAEDEPDRIEFLRVAGILRDLLPPNHPMHEEMPEPYEA
jgi:hypothetical protein